MILENEVQERIAAHMGTEAPDLIVEACTLCERLWMASIDVSEIQERRVDRILKRAEARLERREFATLAGEPCQVRAKINAPAAGMEETRVPASLLSLAFEQAERELGARIGYPALVYDQTANDRTDNAHWRSIATTRLAQLKAAETQVELVARDLDDARARERAVGADMVAVVNAAAAYLAVMTWSPATDPKWKPGSPIPDYRTPENRLRKVLAGPARPGVELLADVAQPAKTINDLRARLDTAMAHIGALVGDAADEDTRDAARAWLRRGA